MDSVENTVTDSGFAIEGLNLPKQIEKPKLVYLFMLWALFAINSLVASTVNLVLSRIHVPENFQLLVFLICAIWLLAGLFKANITITLLFGGLCVYSVFAHVYLLLTFPENADVSSVIIGVFVVKLTISLAMAILIFRRSFIKHLKAYEKHCLQQDRLKASKKALTKKL